MGRMISLVIAGILAPGLATGLARAQEPELAGHAYIGEKGGLAVAQTSYPPDVNNPMVFSGETGDYLSKSPRYGVTIELHGSDDRVNWTFLGTTQSALDGSYAFTVVVPYACYRIRSGAVAGYQLCAVETFAGVVRDDVILLPTPPYDDFPGNNFWYCYYQEPQPQPRDPSAGLVVYYPLDTPYAYENEGIVYDCSGNGNHGRWGNAPKQWEDGPGPCGGKAAVFDGATTIEFYKPPGVPNNAITVAGWFCVSEIRYPWMTGWTFDGDEGPRLSLNGWEPQMHWSPIGAPYYIHVNGPKFPIGQWLHVVGVYDGQTVLLYYNSAEVARWEWEGRWDDHGYTPCIGNNLQIDDRGWHGRISHFALWNRALTEEEIVQVYQACRLGDCGYGYPEDNTIPLDDFEAYRDTSHLLQSWTAYGGQLSLEPRYAHSGNNAMLVVPDGGVDPWWLFPFARDPLASQGGTFQVSLWAAAFEANPFDLPFGIPPGWFPGWWGHWSAGEPDSGGMSVLTFTVTGSQDPATVFDQYYYVYTDPVLDPTESARVLVETVVQTITEIPGTGAKAGLMYRQDLRAEAPYFAVWVNPAGVVKAEYRATAGGRVQTTGSLWIVPPCKLRLEIDEQHVTGYAGSGTSTGLTPIPGATCPIDGPYQYVGPFLGQGKGSDAPPVAQFSELVRGTQPFGQGAATSWGSLDVEDMAGTPIGRNEPQCQPIASEDDREIEPMELTDGSGWESTPIRLREPSGPGWTAQPGNIDSHWTELRFELPPGFSNFSDLYLQARYSPGRFYYFDDLTFRAVSPLPDTGYESLDIGDPWFHGRFRYYPDTGKYHLEASGADIWGTFDQFHYAFKPRTGNGELGARVITMQNTHPWAKAGVMVRQGLDAHSRHVSVGVTPSSGVYMQWRGIPSGATDHTPGSDARAPHWVKVRRIDHTFTGYESADGVGWTEIGTQTVAMPSSAYWGLLLTSHDDSESCKADFDNVKFVPLP